MEPRLLLCICFLSCCLALKCRSQDGAGGDEELKRVVRSCMQRAAGGGRAGDGVSGGGRGRDSGNQQQQQQQQQEEERRYNYQRGQDYEQPRRWPRGATSRQSSNNNPGELQGCVAQCFFEELNMVDAAGQPDRRKVSYLLTKDLRDRGLRNFYMDTVQQCFRYLEQRRPTGDSCQQSRELIKCMSEYAKAQCEDWDEHANLLFN